ncbi:MAG: hypothetical protein KDB03_13525 [Planctomycetales bacterium]|nr:hypothetical protein [Planctomycetales bacterium]
MTIKPSDRIAERFRLTLSESWQRWFDEYALSLPIAGQFRNTVVAEDLCSDPRGLLWPGMMRPDTLPLVTNNYGDWLSARVDKNSEIAEVVHWYHGGGDWLPVGNCMAEALLHDAVDHFRGSQPQNLRGAEETLPPNHREEVWHRFSNPDFSDWLLQQLPCPGSAEKRVVMEAIAETLQRNDYLGCLRVLQRTKWAEAAVSCDLVGELLTTPMHRVAGKYNFADPASNLEHHPLFDLGLVDEGQWRQLSDRLVINRHEQVQNWDHARQICEQVIRSRQDLGWSFDIAGWAAERCQEVQTALKFYEAGLTATSFSDQSVRMRTYGPAHGYAKFSVQRFMSLTSRSRPTLETSLAHATYLDAVCLADFRQRRLAVYNYWLEKGDQKLAEGDFSKAYDCYYLAGWDLGLESPRIAFEILQRLLLTSEKGGFCALAEISKSYLQCLAPQELY